MIFERMNLNKVGFKIMKFFFLGIYIDGYIGGRLYIEYSGFVGSEDRYESKRLLE